MFKKKLIIFILSIVLIVGAVFSFIYWDKVKVFFQGQSNIVDDNQKDDVQGDIDGGEGNTPGTPGTPDKPNHGEIEEDYITAGLMFAQVKEAKNLTFLIEEVKDFDYVFPDGATAESCLKITAVVPSGGLGNALLWETSYVNPQSAWVKEMQANGKTLGAFVRIVQDNISAYVYCMDRFEEQIQIDVYSVLDESVSGVIVLDYDLYEVPPKGVTLDRTEIIF